MSKKPITDGVVLLREWEDEDADWYASAVRDDAIQRYTTEPASLTADEVRAALAEVKDRPGLASFVICAASSGERLGNIGVSNNAGVGDVSYWVAAEARGRGVASRALALISSWALSCWDIPELRLWTHAENLASRRVAERAGYRRAPEDDCWRDVKGTTWPTTAYVFKAAD